MNHNRESLEWELRRALCERPMGYRPHKAPMVRVGEILTVIIVPVVFAVVCMGIWWLR